MTQSDWFHRTNPEIFLSHDWEKVAMPGAVAFAAQLVGPSCGLSSHSERSQGRT